MSRKQNPDSKTLLMFGALGGAAYLAYKAFSQPTAATAGTTPATTPKIAPVGPLITAKPPLVSQPTPTIVPVVPYVLTATALQQAAQASSNPTMNAPDAWNWIISNVLLKPELVTAIDAAFGPVGTVNRDSTYSAGDFLAYSNGSKTLPTNQPTALPPTAPPPYVAPPQPSLTDLQQAQMNALLTRAGVNVTQLYTADQWEYYANQAGQNDNIDAIFGDASGPGRQTPITAAEFVIAVDAGNDANLGLSGMMPSSISWSGNPLAYPKIPRSRWAGQGASTPILPLIDVRVSPWGYD